jgi:Phage gp6-like head-tail connector protein
MSSPYISLTEAKAQLRIDAGLTIDDAHIEMLIGAACDWAENYTQRSLGELLELDSPADSNAVPLPDPKDSPHFEPLPGQPPSIDIGGIQGGFPLYMDDNDQWTEETWRRYWANNPMLKDDSKPLRRDVKAGILLQVELMYDKNVANFEMLETRAEQLLAPYRIGMGV